MTVTVERRRFTVDEFRRLAEVGLVAPDERLELIEGEVMRMSPIGRRHAGCVDYLTTVLARQCGEGARVRVQNPLSVDTASELYPDVALVKARADFYRRENPTGLDALLVIEVSDTTLVYDSDVKVPLYARAGVPVVWVVDLQGQAVEVFTGPTPNGYDARRRHRPGETLDCPAVSGVAVPVSELVA